MRHSIVVLAAGLALASSAPAAGAQVVNGSFESPGTTLGCPSFFGGVVGTTITGWTVGSGNVDYICSLWTADDGVMSLDMNGSAAASIYQDVALTPGASYRLSFAMGENFFAGPNPKTMDVTIGSLPTWSFSFDNPAATAADMGWATNTVDFVANAATMRLTFASTTAECCWGPALDDVSIALISPTAVPEPATVALLGAGLGVLGVAMRRRRA